MRQRTIDGRRRRHRDASLPVRLAPFRQLQPSVHTVVPEFPPVPGRRPPGFLGRCLGCPICGPSRPVPAFCLWFLPPCDPDPSLPHPRVCVPGMYVGALLLRAAPFIAGILFGMAMEIADGLIALIE